MINTTLSVTVSEYDSAMGPTALRARLLKVSSAKVDGCTASCREGGISPVAACARHKAHTVEDELGTLAVNEVAVLVQLEATRDAAIAAGCHEHNIGEMFERRAAEVRAAATAKRIALQVAAVAVDAALEEALATAAALVEVRDASCSRAG